MKQNKIYNGGILPTVTIKANKTMKINLEQLNSIASKLSQEYVDSLNTVFEKYQINTILRINHFLAQVLHESGGLKVFEENLNYSSKGLLAVFGKYFTVEQAEEYHRQPEKIANRVYANRMGNGDEESGDGWKYRGRGAIQLTGKDNYSNISKDFSILFTHVPNNLSALPYNILSAGWFWDKSKLNKLADKDDIEAITKKINGGINGIDDRKEWLAKCKLIIR